MMCGHPLEECSLSPAVWVPRVFSVLVEYHVGLGEWDDLVVYLDAWSIVKTACDPLCMTELSVCVISPVVYGKSS